MDELRQIDRFNLLDAIGRELQARMTFSDIDTYLGGFGVDTKAVTPSVNSKWVYVKEVLAEAPGPLVLQIAKDLELEHPFRGPSGRNVADSRFWAPNHFRLFISHLTSFKKQTSLLAHSLQKYGISAFVAHEDIEPTREWLLEIENALFSMDSLLAILTPKFNESLWVDQEVGVAVGRDVLVVPIKKGMDPYGFIGKFQALQGHGKTVATMAREVFEVLLTNSKSKKRMVDCLVDLFLVSQTEDGAAQKLELMQQAPVILDAQLDRLRENTVRNSTLAESTRVLDEVNALLLKHQSATIDTTPEEPLDDSDVPF